MGLFGKEDEYVDYTLLKKRGLLKINEEPAQPGLKTEGGFIDLTPARKDSEKPAAANFGFLSEMASAGSGQTSTSLNPLANFDSVTPALAAEPAGTDEKEFSALKIKVDDIDYKIDRFIERIDRLEEKLAKLGQGNF